jgi:hypothetical protein
LAAIKVYWGAARLSTGFMGTVFENKNLFKQRVIVF